LRSALLSDRLFADIGLQGKEISPYAT